MTSEALGQSGGHILYSDRCPQSLDNLDNWRKNTLDCRKRKATGTHKTRGGTVKKGKTQKLIPKLKFEKSRNYPSKDGVKIQDPKIPGKRAQTKAGSWNKSITKTF